MSEWPEALVEKVAKAIYADERATIDPGWPAWDDIGAESRKGVMETASAALDALGLREDRRVVKLAGNDTPVKAREGTFVR